MSADDYRHRRARRGYGDERRRLLAELRAERLTEDHLIILTCAYTPRVGDAPIPPSSEHVTALDACRTRMAAIKAWLNAICHDPPVPAGA